MSLLDCLLVDILLLRTTCVFVLPIYTCTFGGTLIYILSDVFVFVILFSHVSFPVNFKEFSVIK